MVTVWDDMDYMAIKVQHTPVTNDKQYLKTVKLDNHSITTIICQNGYTSLLSYIHCIVFTGLHWCGFFSEI